MALYTLIEPLARHKQVSQNTGNLGPANREHPENFNKKRG